MEMESNVVHKALVDGSLKSRDEGGFAETAYRFWRVYFGRTTSACCETLRHDLS